MKRLSADKIKQLLSSRVFIRYLFVFFLCFTIPTASLGSFLLVNTRNNLRDKVDREYDYEFRQACNDLNSELLGLMNSALRLGSIRWVTQIMALPDNSLRSHITPYSRYEALRMTQIFSEMITAADDIAICFPGQNAVFSSIWFDTMDAFFTLDFQWADKDFLYWKGLLSQKNEMHVVPLEEIQRLGHAPAEYLTIIQTLSPSGGWEDASILFFVSKNHLLNLYSAVLQEGGFIEIKDKEGTTIFHEYGTDNTNRMFLYNMTLTGAKWQIYCGIPFSAASSEIFILTSYTVYLGILFFILILALSYALAKINYKPIYEVASVVSGNQQLKPDHLPKKESDEFGYVINQWHGMQARLGTYTQQLADYRLLAKAHCMQTLLDMRAGSMERISKHLSILETDLSMAHFRCVLLLNSESHMIPDDIDESISCSLFSTLTAQVGTSIVILCNYNADDGFSVFRKKLDAFLAESEQHSAIRIVGPEQDCCVDFIKSYHAANYSVQKLLTKRQSDDRIGWYFADPIPDEMLRVQFSLTEEETLINLLKIGDAAGSSEFAIMVLNKNAALPTDAVVSLYHILLILPFRILEESVTKVCYEYLQESINANSLTSMTEHIQQLYSDICLIQLSRICTYDDEVMNWIAEYVETNAFDPDLSLKQLSEEFQLSLSQISRLFKKKMTVGFADWLMERRITRAKELLISDDNSAVSDIALKSGFSSEKTFHRAFKKHTGITPTEFRNAQ